jgi:hypothetical protein
MLGGAGIRNDEVATRGGLTFFLGLNLLLPLGDGLRHLLIVEVAHNDVKVDMRADGHVEPPLGHCSSLNRVSVPGGHRIFSDWIFARQLADWRLADRSHGRRLPTRQVGSGRNAHQGERGHHG